MSAHTPGPWRWEINLKHKELRLCGGVPRFDADVVSFRRWGMTGATATFRHIARHTMESAAEFVAPIPGREHHADWCASVNHPDARLIEAAPELLHACKTILTVLDQESFEPEDLGEASHWLRSAIAKAEGR